MNKIKELFLGLHQFPWLGIRYGMGFGGFLNLPFYRVHKLMLATDALLTLWVWLALFWVPAMITMGMFLPPPGFWWSLAGLCIVSVWILKRTEEKEKNKKFIRDLPKVLARAGFQLEQQPPTVKESAERSC